PRSTRCVTASNPSCTHPHAPDPAALPAHAGSPVKCARQAVAATIVGTWIGVSCFPDWPARWSYGPRFLADVVLLVVWVRPPIFEAIARARRVGDVVPACLPGALR